MTLVICICTYNRNLSLIRCLRSINKIYLVSNIKIKIIVVDNSYEYSSLKSVQKLKKSLKYKIIQIHEKKRGVVYARNKCLREVKKINPKFICFFDDDCVVDRFWLKNVFKIIKLTNAEIATGPQLPLNKKYFIHRNQLIILNFLKNNIKKI